MKSYLQSILTVLLVSGLASALMPDGESKKGVRFALSLLVLLTIISPLREDGFSSFLPSYSAGAFPDGETDGHVWLTKKEAAAIEEGIEYYLCQTYRLPKDTIRAEIICTVHEHDGAREVRVSHATLHLYGQACLGNVPRMVEDIKKELDAECEVVYHRA